MRRTTSIAGLVLGLLALPHSSMPQQHRLLPQTTATSSFVLPAFSGPLRNTKNTAVLPNENAAQRYARERASLIAYTNSEMVPRIFAEACDHTERVTNFYNRRTGQRLLVLAKQAGVGDREAPVAARARLEGEIQRAQAEGVAVARTTRKGNALKGVIASIDDSLSQHHTVTHLAGKQELCERTQQTTAQFFPYFERIATQYGVPAELLVPQLGAEGGWHAHARSLDRRRRVVAQGIGQFLVSINGAVRQQSLKKGENYHYSDMFAQSAMTAAALSVLHKLTPNMCVNGGNAGAAYEIAANQTSWMEALSIYHAGPGNSCRAVIDGATLLVLQGLTPLAGQRFIVGSEFTKDRTEADNQFRVESSRYARNVVGFGAMAERIVANVTPTPLFTYRATKRTALRDIARTTDIDSELLAQANPRQLVAPIGVIPARAWVYVPQTIPDSVAASLGLVQEEPAWLGNNQEREALWSSWEMYVPSSESTTRREEMRQFERAFDSVGDWPLAAMIRQYGFPPMSLPRVINYVTHPNRVRDLNTFANQPEIKERVGRLQASTLQ